MESAQNYTLASEIWWFSWNS